MTFSGRTEARTELSGLSPVTTVDSFFENEFVSGRAGSSLLHWRSLAVTSGDCFSCTVQISHRGVSLVAEHRL